MKQTALCLAVVGSLAIAIGSASAAGTYLPFGDGFEWGTHGTAISTKDWYSSTSGVARLDNLTSTIDGSTNTCFINENATFLVDDGSYNYTNVWCSFYTKVTTHSADPDNLSSGTAAGFFVKSNGDLRAFDGNAWTTVASGIPTSGWIGFAVHLDYVNDTWDIYKTPNSYSYGDELTKLNGSPLAMNSAFTGTEFTQASVEGTTYLDELAVSADDVTVDGSSPGKAANAGIGIMLGENLTGILTKYFDAADCYMDGKLGTAISSGLDTGDIVYVYVPGSGPQAGWNALTCDGPGQGFTPSGSGLLIRPTTAVFVQFVGSGPRTPAMVSGYDSLQQPSATTPVETGWNAMTVPLGAGSVTLSALNLPSLTAGDQLWIRRMNGGYEIPIYYSGTNWLRGRTNVDGFALQPGQTFWYRRSGAGASWNASGMTVN